MIRDPGEKEFATVGSFAKFDRLLHEQGLDPVNFWRSLDQTFVSYFTAIRNELFAKKGESDPGVVLTFDADVGVHATGTAELYEVHPAGWDAPKGPGHHDHPIQGHQFVGGLSTLCFLFHSVGKTSTSIEQLRLERTIAHDLALSQVWPSDILDEDTRFLAAALDDQDRTLRREAEKAGLLVPELVNTSSRMSQYWREAMTTVYEAVHADLGHTLEIEV